MPIPHTMPCPPLGDLVVVLLPPPPPPPPLLLLHPHSPQPLSSPKCTAQCGAHVARAGAWSLATSIGVLAAAVPVLPPLHCLLLPPTAPCACPPVCAHLPLVVAWINREQPTPHTHAAAVLHAAALPCCRGAARMPPHRHRAHRRCPAVPPARARPSALGRGRAPARADQCGACCVRRRCRLLEDTDRCARPCGTRRTPRERCRARARARRARRAPRAAAAQ